LNPSSELSSYLKPWGMSNDFIITPSIQLSSSKKLKRFNKPHVLDRMMYCTSNNRYLSDVYNIASSFKTAVHMDLTSWSRLFHGSEEHLELVEFTKQMHKSDASIIVIVDDNTQEHLVIDLPMSEHVVNYSHVHKDYRHSQEFLMSPFAVSGITMQGLLERYGSPFGPKLLKMFQSMGYTVKGLECDVFQEQGI
jgi:hypothetical protein